ncbi:hypothetical protein BOW15_09275 [Solemya velum gill symbiont]|nr:hypothetical protein BOW15_09275 [Solemya velum gill symbiont]
MAWCHAQAGNILDDLDQHRVLLLSNSLDGLATSHYRQILGKEFDCIIYDCFSGLDADALGSVCGTVRGGGALILLTPPLTDWSNFKDPDYRRHGYTDNEKPQGLFIQRLVHLLLNSDAATSHKQKENKQVNISLKPVTATAATDDQLHTIEAIERVALGHAKRPLVIKADRGRGKSAAIGIAAAKLLEKDKRNILVTAPSFAAVETLFRHAADNLPGFAMQQQALTHADGRRLAFIAPDKLVHDKPACDLLCVDEAAAIPAQLLEAMLKQQNRILFSTTVHGYEGSGRGFEIRFSKVLERLTPQWKTTSLKAPIRWRDGDALEALLNDLLLFDADQTAFDTDMLDSSDLVISCVTQQELFKDEAALRAFFGLLVTAHSAPSTCATCLMANNYACGELQSTTDWSVLLCVLKREISTNNSLKEFAAASADQKTSWFRRLCNSILAWTRHWRPAICASCASLSPPDCNAKVSADDFCKQQLQITVNQQTCSPPRSEQLLSYSISGAQQVSHQCASDSRGMHQAVAIQC